MPVNQKFSRYQRVWVAKSHSRTKFGELLPLPYSPPGLEQSDVFADYQESGKMMQKVLKTVENLTRNQGRRHGVDWGGHVHPTFLGSVFNP